MRAFVFALYIGISVSAFAQATADKLDSAVRAANNRFAGVWKLIGEDTRDANGRIVPRDANAGNGGRFGYIVYDPAGYMGVTLSWLKQPAFAGGKATTPQEALAALGAYNSYWGSFAVNEARGVVTHQTFGALSPAFSGTNQERQFTISGNRLTLRPPSSANGDQRTLTWERVPNLPNLTPTHRKLIGFWKLISLEGRDANGRLSSNPGMTGFIVYTASGHVMVHMMQPYRRRNVGPSPTPEETMATYRSYTSYFGPYTVNEPEHFVVHHLAAAFNSAPVGTDYQRFLEFTGKRLTLKPPATTNGNGETVQMRIVWERLSE
jgi:hypothetical protein